MTAGGVSAAAVTGVSGSGTSYTVTVATGTGDGTLRLDVRDDDTILDAETQPLGGAGIDNGAYDGGEVYTIDRTAPEVVSITRSSGDPTAASSVDYLVTFSEPVVGVDASDFLLNATGISGAAIASVLGSGTTRTVNVATGTGDGSIRLDLVDNDSVTDSAGNALGGSGAGNGDAVGETWTIKKSVDIFGTMWDDVDGDGIRDPGEAGLAGVTVYLDTNTDGMWEDGEPIMVTRGDDSGTSGVDESGTYEFTALAAGTHVVAEIAPAGTNQTFPGSGGNGRLTFAGVASRLTHIEDAEFVAVSPDGKNVLVTGRRWESLVNYVRDPLTGQTTWMQSFFDTDAGIDGLNNPVWVAFSPGGEHVYVAANDDNAVSVFSRDTATGQLAFVQVVKDGVDGADGLYDASSITVSPDGNHVYVGSANEIALYDRNTTTGQLTFVSMTNVYYPFSVALSPDGNQLYATSPGIDTLTVYTRDPVTGAISLLESFRDGQDGVDGMDGARSGVVSSDGRHVYVAGLNEDAIAVFSRDLLTGRLTFVEAVRDNVNGVDGLDYPTNITLSPDGGSLYAGSGLEDAVAVFDRDAVSGRLSFLESHHDGVDGVDGLDYVETVAVSPDGRHMYSVSLGDDA
ncbi:MAG: beta-propeller fold lactonase family protein, partial [Planctomycetes bacterium]|nr:beta-propeller fold lactonase family protein [Planctomycetota bacterium]